MSTDPKANIEQSKQFEQPVYTLNGDGAHSVKFMHAACITQDEYGDNLGTPIEFLYNTEWTFASKEEAENFSNHPELREIYNTIDNMIKEGVDESLEFEVGPDGRDTDEVYIQEGTAGPGTLTSGTVGDIEATIEMVEVIPIINETYGVNITGFSVPAEVGEIAGCILDAPAPIPDDVAKLEETIKPSVPTL